MNPIEALLQALSTIGTGTPSSSDALVRELAAQQELERQGSVMAKPQNTQGPAMRTISTLINALDPTNWMGGVGGAGLAHVPGTYRSIGLARAAGDMNPTQYAAAIQAQPNVQRFLSLVQSLVRRAPGYGEEFPIFRGKQITDPLIKALSQNSSELPITAVSTKPDIADYFARVAAETTRKPAMIAAGKGTPESVVGLLPRRNTMAAHEGELVINPNLLKERPQLMAQVSFDKGMPFYTTPRTPQGGGEPINDIYGLFHRVAETNPINEIVRALAEAKLPPTY